MIDSLVAIDGDEVLTWVASQFTVKVVSCHDGLLVLCEAASRLFYDGIDLRHHLVECFLVDVQHFLLQFVYLGKNLGTLIDRSVFDGGLQFVNLFFLLHGRVLHLTLNIFCALAQLVVVEHLRSQLFFLR